MLLLIRKLLTKALIIIYYFLSCSEATTILGKQAPYICTVELPDHSSIIILASSSTSFVWLQFLLMHLPTHLLPMSFQTQYRTPF